MVTFGRKNIIELLQNIRNTIIEIADYNVNLNILGGLSHLFLHNKPFTMTECTKRQVEAANSLADMLTDMVPVLSVGIGQDVTGSCLIVYLSQKIGPSEYDQVPPLWEDFPVKVSIFGKAYL
jgi:hypothetical protein